MYRSLHDKFKKHGFELKSFFSILSKLNQVKVIKADGKLQAHVTLQILCNYWTPSKIHRNIYENVKTWNFFQNFMKNPVKIDKIHEELSTSILWRNYQIWYLSFRHFLLNMNPVSRTRNSMIRNKIFLRFKRTFPKNFFINFYQKEVLNKIMQNN